MFLIFTKHQNHVIGAAFYWYLMGDTCILACMLKIDVSNVGFFNVMTSSKYISEKALEPNIV